MRTGPWRWLSRQPPSHPRHSSALNGQSLLRSRQQPSLQLPTQMNSWMQRTRQNQSQSRSRPLSCSALQSLLIPSHSLSLQPLKPVNSHQSPMHPYQRLLHSSLLLSSQRQTPTNQSLMPPHLFPALSHLSVLLEHRLQEPKTPFRSQQHLFRMKRYWLLLRWSQIQGR